MTGVVELYAAQPFWFWLALGVLLLAVEAALSTEWLLWPAVAAGIVAAVTALCLRIGFGGELLLFAALTIGATLLSRRLIQRVNPDDQPDINDRDRRLVGQRARVVEPFIDGRGRVFVSGAEWPAEIEGEPVLVGDSVIVESSTGSGLRVRPA